MKGIYILQIKIQKNIFINIGSLKIVYFTKGNYVYIGSAQNSLDKRITRHLKDSREKRLHWHIDYLLNNNSTKIEKVYYKYADKKEECNTAQFFINNKVNNPIKDFGCSDCKCESHLIKSNIIPIGFFEFKK
jgi:Uri superfamily endonuclease